MDNTYTVYRVHQCSKCPGDTGYYCASCPCDLCHQCKESHIKDLKTIDHDVVSHRDKINYIPTQEICVRHPSNLYKTYCEFCQLPICYHCRKHRRHRQLNIKTAFETKRQQGRGTIQIITREALFYRPILLQSIKDDVKTLHTEISLYQSKMYSKAQTLKHLIQYVLNGLLNSVFCDFDFKHRCLKEKVEMKRHIASLQRYVHRYEQPEFTFSALQFLSSIKTALTNIHLTLHTQQLFVTESFNKNDIMKSLSALQITERGNRRVGNEYLLKLMPGAELHQTLKVSGVDNSFGISRITSDLVLVSDVKNSILTNRTGAILHRMRDVCSGLYDGQIFPTVNNANELIFVDRNHNIRKLLNNLRTTIFIENTSSFPWPECMYWSPYTGDLLVGYGEFKDDKKKKMPGKVTRFNPIGQLIQTIQHDNTGLKLFKYPRSITENNNGDVVVSDLFAVVVIERSGKHRFSYTGHPSGSKLNPQGICTDALSHILVCDNFTNTVHMLNKNGQFLSYLLIRPSGIFRPWALSYDVNTHRLWVGSGNNNTVVIYRYITRQDALTAMDDATESLIEIQVTGNEKTQQGNQCLLKLMSPPAFLHSLKVSGVYCCLHISYVTSDSVWASDGNTNLILTDTRGVAIQRVKDACKGLYGLHTVNSECDLIYIDRQYNINKLSKDMKTTSTFIKRTNFTWRPQSVYWSPPTGDLLVGMHRKETTTGKVTRYSKSGQLKQTIQHDNTGLDLYTKPCYITENKNGDVVVSDCYGCSGAVVVTEREGKHRFTYTGHPSGSGLDPQGICTDELSHILVCNYQYPISVQIIDSDGQFLSNLLIKSDKTSVPCSLSYDTNTHRLWIGSASKNKKVDVYKYGTIQDAVTDKNTSYPDGKGMSTSAPAVERK